MSWKRNPQKLVKDYVLGEITKNWAMDYILEKILEKLVAGQNLGKNPPEIVHSLRDFLGLFYLFIYLFLFF